MDPAADENEKTNPALTTLGHDEPTSYEDHLVASHGETTMVGGLFDAMEEMVKGAVGLHKGLADALLDLGRAFAHEAQGRQATPPERGQDARAPEDQPQIEDEHEAVARNARAEAQWAEIVRNRAQEQDRDQDRDR